MSDQRNQPALTHAVSSRGLHYERRGDGPPVVLVHGWCLSAEMWLYQQERLLHDHTVITVDLPGFGRSRDLAGPYALDRYANELGLLLRELELEDAVVVGFAFGAAVAMTLAAAGDVQPAGLVLIGAPSAAHAAYDRMPRAMRRDWHEFARRSALAICKRPLSDAATAWLATIFGSTPLPVALETVAQLARFEPADVAGAISVDALFVHGELDDVVPVAVSEACAKAMPNAAVRVVADSGHLVPIDQPEELSAAIAAYVAARAPGAGGMS
jgi:pimeloyl-ACP methyl ester carboxylesterase